MKKLLGLLFTLCVLGACACAVEGEWIVHEEVEMEWGELRWFDDSALREAEPNGRTVWHSSNSDAAVVDKWGNVQAAKPDSVQTTFVTAERGGVSYSWKVTVRPLSGQILLFAGDEHIENAVLDLDAGQTQLRLRALVLPEGAGQQVIFSVHGKGAQIDESGLLTVQGDGSFTVTAKAQDRGRAQAQCTVHALHPVRSVTLSGPSQLTSGEIASLTAQIEPQSATFRQLEWRSGDETVAKADKNGNIKAMPVDEVRQVRITASAVDGSGVYAEHTLTVVPAAQKVDILYNGQSFPAQSLIVDDSRIGTVIAMSAEISPAQALQEVCWSSSDTRIAKVDSAGRIGIVGKGRCRITAQAADGSGAKRVLHIAVGNTEKYPYYLEVDKGNQVVRVYEKDADGLYTVLSRRMICSTGTYDGGLENGLYTVHSTRHKWMSTVVEGTYAKWGTRFAEHIWFHSLPYQGTNSARMDEQAYALLGARASHGCIRLLAADAKWIHDNVPGGSWMIVCKCERDEAEWGSVTKPEAQDSWDPTDNEPENPHYDPAYTSAVLPPEFAPENRQKH